MTDQELHAWLPELGAYLLGALEPDEAERFRRHLATCPVCQAENRALDPVAALLAGAPAGTLESAGTGAYSAALAAPDPALWDRLRARAGFADGEESAGEPAGPAHAPAESRTWLERLRRPLRPAAAAALSGALVAAAAVAIFAGVHAADDTGGAPLDTASARDTSDGVSATIQYRPTDWGSWVQVTLSGVPSGADCVMYAVDASGHRAVAGSWWAPEYSSQSETIPGGVAMQSSDIREFVIETADGGRVLLTVPAS